MTPFSVTHFSCSLSINWSMQWSRIFSRFSISLMLYFVRYLLSRRFKLSQGNFSQSKQYSPFRSLQLLISQDTRVFGPAVPIFRHLTHLFVVRRYALHMPQFIPQVEIKFSGILSMIYYIKFVFIDTISITVILSLKLLYY